MTRPQATIVVTGSELVRGELADGNGPFLARELLRLGVEPARIVVVGDRVDDLERVLRDAVASDLCVVSGGLGPTHDDRTVELLARVTGRRLVVDPALEQEIGTVSREIARRLRRPFHEFEPGVRKQATLPEGAVSLGLAGTAPGFALDVGDGAAVALPGPPRELQRLWARAVESDPVCRVLERARPREVRRLRLFGVSESAVARALTDAGGEAAAEATICARDFEIHVDVHGDDGAAAALADALADRLEPYVFARDASSVAQVVLSLCRDRGLTLAAAESCTGGLVSKRLTDVAGSSDAFAGGIVAYSNEVKAAQLGVAEEILRTHGAVSAETAAAMARGAREQLGVDVAVSVTGVAGPDGGTPAKPVGLVYLHAVGPDGELPAEFNLPGEREMIRGRAAALALHLVRRLLTQS